MSKAMLDGFLTVAPTFVSCQVKRSGPGCAGPPGGNGYHGPPDGAGPGGGGGGHGDWYGGRGGPGAYGPPRDGCDDRGPYGPGPGAGGGGGGPDWYITLRSSCMVGGAFVVGAVFLLAMAMFKLPSCHRPRTSAV
jgi:hypothetical protein